MAGYYVAVTKGNVFWYTVCILLNIIILKRDKEHFYGRCQKKLAKKIIRAERQLGYSIITRISLIFTAVSLPAVMIMTDASEYYLDKKTGKIYRMKDYLDL